MRLSQFFLPTFRETPSRTGVISHALMLRAGMIHQESAGIYSWLPLGLRVLENITRIITREMDAIGALKILMPTIQSADIWKESGRWDDYGPEMLRIRDRHGQDILYGPTNEEMITAIARDFLKSYRQLPLLVYQNQWKFRDEIRPRFGVMRGREFLMKDGYSFDLNPEKAREVYRRMFACYHRIFAAIGLPAIAVKAPSGTIGGNTSHEFHILAESGESTLYYDRRLTGETDPDRAMSRYAMEESHHDPALYAKPPYSSGKEDIIRATGIEVGHIFYFGTKYSKAMRLRISGEQTDQGTGSDIIPCMGSYGIGISRLPGAVIEAGHDDKGIIWPPSIAPFQVALVNLAGNDAAVTAMADTIYEKLRAAKIDVLYDDRSARAGVKLADMDLIGLPWRIATGKRHIANRQVELQRRGTNGHDVLDIDDALSRICHDRHHPTRSSVTP